jgi:hypothetical protein
MLEGYLLFKREVPDVGDEGFKKLIQSKGGWWESELDQESFEWISALEGRIERKINKFHDDFYVDKSRRLYWGIVNDSSCNAFCCSSITCEFDFVGINIGTIMSFSHIFNRLLSHNMILQSLGDTSLEDSSRTKVNIIYSDATKIDSDVCMPNCPVRAAFAQMAISAAVDFIIYHECTHILNGHTEYKYRENMGKSMSYIDEEVFSKNVNNITSQTLEMDADAGAVYYTLKEVFFMLSIYKATPTPPSIKDALGYIYETPISALVYVSFVIDVAIKIFDGEVIWDASSQIQWSHPMPNLRRYLNHVQMWTLTNVHLKQLVDKNMEREFVMKSFENMTTLDMCWSDIQSLPLNHKLVYQDVFENQGIKAYCQLFKEKWAEIRPRLFELKKGRVIP